ncbi:MAG TPA: response regulator transcription factor, partial [Candidatus Limnocylindrales bacterium]|nr:response regulator transcription factor [Candidatus Limnocylindrales bacterium]
PAFGVEGLDAAIAIRERHPSTAILLLSAHVETRHAIRLLQADPAGVGYLLKDRVLREADLVDAIRRVASGGSVIDPEVVGRLLGRARPRGPLDELTGREREVLALMAEGRSNQAIAERLVVEPKTIEGHIRTIFSKLGLEPEPADHRRVLAVLLYLRS